MIQQLKSGLYVPNGRNGHYADDVVTMEKVSPYHEMGSTGITRWKPGMGQSVVDEQLRQLQGHEGRVLYEEMRKNHPVVKAVLFGFQTALLAVEYRAVPVSDRAEDVRAAEFVDECLGDMSASWQDTMTFILPFLWQGFSLTETTYKKRLGRNPPRYGQLKPGEEPPVSQYNDGAIGWRKWSPRPADTLAPGREWLFDEHGGIQGIQQQGDAITGFRPVPISIDRLLLFRLSAGPRNSPESEALALDTPIPTPSGWTTMGHIKVGDMVYGSDGKIRYVVAKSPVHQDRPVYEVEFSGGHKIVADADHLWSVTTFNDRNLRKPPRLMRTKELYDVLQSEKTNPRFCAGVAPVLDTPEIDLPIDPYVLGYWLGDGNRQGGSIACHVEDYANLQEQLTLAGYESRHDGNIVARADGLQTQLRVADLIKNKHIPRNYLRASYADRLALLQGLMDSDGNSHPGNDKASKFFNTDADLVKQFIELVRTLGSRPRVRIMKAAGQQNGEIAGHAIIMKKNLYEVSFFLGEPVHRLPRKAEKQSIKDNCRVRGHYIQSIVPAGTADVACIQVDAPDNLYLAGEGMVPTHNSLLRAMYWPFYYSTQIAEIEGIGIERDLAGLPVFYLGEGSSLNPDDTNSDYKLAQRLVVNIRNDAQAGVVIPKPKMTADGRGMLLELLSTGGSRQFDTDAVINRWHKLIALSGLAQFIMLGLEKVGTQALAGVQSGYYNLALNGVASNVSDVITRHAIPRLFAMNPQFRVEELPPVEASTAGVPDLEGLADFINAAAGKNLLTYDAELENSLRVMAGLPEKPVELLETEPEPETPDVPEDVEESLEARDYQRFQDLELPDKRTKPGGPLFERRTNEYQAALEQTYIDWYEDTARRMAATEDDDERDEELAAALLLLARRLIRLGRERLPEALRLGAGDTPPTPEAWADMQRVLADNERYISDSFVPAVGERVRKGMTDDGARDAASIGGWFQTMLSRLALYAGPYYMLTWKGWSSRLEDVRERTAEEPAVEWVLDERAKHCSDCLALAGTYSGGMTELLAVSGGRLPGDPRLEDRGNCRCHLRYQTQSGMWTR